MKQTTRPWLAGTLAIGATLLLFAGGNQAQEKKPHDASALNDALRDVINAGAKVFNEQGDHAGCYRMYQGSLISVRPFLAADLRKKIDAGMAKADKLGTFADRAFELRRVLDEIRASTKGGGTPSSDKGTVTGKLMFQGQAVAGGYFVTLVSKDGKKFSSAIQKDGTFQFKTPVPPGEYRVAIEIIPGEKTKAAALPARYGSEATSGLLVSIQAGTQQVDLNLVK